MEQSGPAFSPPSDWQIDEEYRFVADPHTAAAAARATVSYALRQRNLRRFLGILLTVEALIIARGFDDRLSLVTRLFWGYFWALVPTAIAAAFCMVMTYVRTLRNAQARLAAGMLLRSGFGPHYYVFADAMSTVVSAYTAVSSITVHDEFVFFRVVGRSSPSFAPRSLFPDAALERMRHRPTA